jgi:hypothetical protein
VKKSRSESSERISREAMRLPVERRYKRTSVGDIRQAAGLTSLQAHLVNDKCPPVAGSVRQY